MFEMSYKIKTSQLYGAILTVTQYDWTASGQLALTALFCVPVVSYFCQKSPVFNPYTGQSQ